MILGLLVGVLCLGIAGVSIGMNRYRSVQRIKEQHIRFEKKLKEMDQQIIEYEREVNKQKESNESWDIKIK